MQSMPAARSVTIEYATKDRLVLEHMCAGTGRLFWRLSYHRWHNPPYDGSRPDQPYEWYELEACEFFAIGDANAFQAFEKRGVECPWGYSGLGWRDPKAVIGA